MAASPNPGTAVGVVDPAAAVSRRTGFTVGFLAVTTLAIVLELLAAFDGDPDTTPWTHLLVDHVPAPVTFAAILVLIVWTPWHFWHAYRQRREPKEE